LFRLFHVWCRAEIYNVPPPPLPILVAASHKRRPPDHAFAVISGSGSVIAWGDPSSGGDSRSVKHLLSGGVEQIYASSGAFAAVKRNGQHRSDGDNIKLVIFIFHEIAKNCKELLEIARNCQELPRIARNCQELPQLVRKSARNC
jgi:hypothetical protein